MIEPVTLHAITNKPICGAGPAVPARQEGFIDGVERSLRDATGHPELNAAAFAYRLLTR